MGIKEASEKMSYMVGRQYVERKERILEKAIDFHFGSMDWDEDTLAEHGVMNIYPDGTEVFALDGVELVRFGPTTTKVEIEGSRVTCTVHQLIDELYLS